MFGGGGGRGRPQRQNGNQMSLSNPPPLGTAANSTPASLDKIKNTLEGIQRNHRRTLHGFTEGKVRENLLSLRSTEDLIERLLAGTDLNPAQRTQCLQHRSLLRRLEDVEYLRLGELASSLLLAITPVAELNLEASGDVDENRLFPGGSALIKAPKTNSNSSKLDKEKETTFMLHNVDRETHDDFVERMIQSIDNLCPTRPAFDQVLAGRLRTVFRLNQAASNKRARRNSKVSTPLPRNDYFFLTTPKKQSARVEDSDVNPSRMIRERKEIFPSLYISWKACSDLYFLLLVVPRAHNWPIRYYLQWNAFCLMKIPPLLPLHGRRSKGIGCVPSRRPGVGRKPLPS